MPLLVLAARDACAEDAAIDFSHQVVPILRDHCSECHGGDEAKGSFSLNTRSLIVDAGYVDLDDPDGSYLLELVRSDDPDMQMPPKERERLAPEEIAILRAWIAQAMPWEAGFTFGQTVYEPPLRPRRPQLPPPTAGRTHPIDRILDAYLAERGLPRPEPIDDAVFFRRVHLDLVGLLPEPDQLDAFLADPSPDKRARAIDDLLQRDVAYADHWLTFFNDLLRNDYSGTGFITGGRRQITTWLYDALVNNMPFDQLARQLIAPPTSASQGYIQGIQWRGETSAAQTVEVQFAQSVAQSFLGINIKCASCHDSFIDRWTLDEAYGLAAIYATRPLEIYRCDKPVGRMARAAWLFPELGQIDPDAPQEERLQQLAALMTHPQNGRFARTIVNRLWYKLMGRGIVHPLDAMQSEPWNADLLDYLASYLIQHQYDLRQVLRLIATSEAYQSATEVTEGESGEGSYTYRGPRSRRMTAEQFLDAVWQITGQAPALPDAPVIRSVPAHRGDAAGGDAAGGDRAPGTPWPMQWIWAPSAPDSASQQGTAPAGQQIVMRGTLKLDSLPHRAAAVYTCDNAFTLYVNGREVDRGDDWTRLHTLPLRGLLKQGANQFVVVASNAGSGPNPAGWMFTAVMQWPDDTQRQWASDASWQWSEGLPSPREGRLGALPGPWQPAQEVPTHTAWAQQIAPQVDQQLTVAMAGEVPMVRASLMKNDALMRSLGRPMRDQIVSMRPDGLTTLEAIDLANEQGLADVFAAGGRRLAEMPWQDPHHLVRYLYAYALARPPTAGEWAVLKERLGTQPSPEAVQDVLWAVCMLPEFFLVR